MSYNRSSGTNPFSDPPPPYDDEQRPILDDTVVVTRRRKRSISATICSAIFIVPYTVLLCAPLVTIGFFASKQNELLNHYPSGCLLFATYSGAGGFQLGQNGACSFTVFGEAAITVLGLILIVLTIVKTVWGKW